MAVSIARAVKQYLRPVMEAHGYQYTGTQMGCWDFEKNGRRKQTVFVQRCRNSTLRLELRLSPSFRHKHIEFDEAYLKRYLLYPGMHRDWPFQTQEDVEQIMKCFAQIMEQKGFDMLENAAEDPMDVVPTPQMQERLFAEHARLAERLLRDEGIERWDHSNFAEILASRLMDYQKRFFRDESLEEAVVYAAAYGLVFERMGAVWEMDNGQCVLSLQRKNSHLPRSVYPFTTIFHALHYDKPDTVVKRLEMYVQYALEDCICE